MSISDDMELREDRLAEAYRDWLINEDAVDLFLYACRIFCRNKGKLAGSERESLINMILDRDFTGEHDPAFEDVRNSIK